MGLRVVGAGVGRTGTHSLKLALERLLGEPCHHMVEVFADLDTVPTWHAATRGEAVDWEQLLAGYGASVDWPGAAFWREQAEVWPDALILLSTRESTETWVRSADRTILEPMRQPPPEDAPTRAWFEFVSDLFATRFTDRFDDRQALADAYERHNAAVRSEAPPDRLVEWQPADGWGPLCSALGVPEPDEPFPVTNTTADFRSMLGLPD